MSKAILEHNTWLYSDEAPNGRLFAAGERHPGEGWLDEPVMVLEVPLAGPADDGDAAQALLDAQKAKFDAAWDELAREHDTALADLEKLRAENVALKAQVEEQAAIIARFDADGDGKPGGSKAKA